MKTQANKDLAALRSLDASELQKEIIKAKKDFFLLNMKHRANELKQPHTLGIQKKYLATLEMIKTHL